MRRRRLTATCSVLPSPRGPEAHTALVGVPPESRPFFFCTSQGSSIYLPDLEPGNPSFVSIPSHHPPSHPTPPPGAWPPPPTTAPRCTASLGAPCTRRWCIPVQMTKSSAPGARASLADPPPHSLFGPSCGCVLCAVCSCLRPNERRGKWVCIVFRCNVGSCSENNLNVRIIAFLSFCGYGLHCFYSPVEWSKAHTNTRRANIEPCRRLHDRPRRGGGAQPWRSRCVPPPPDAHGQFRTRGFAFF